MSDHVLTIGPNAPVKELLRLFLAHPVHHLPVVEDRHVVGMLSSADLMGLRRADLLGERARHAPVLGLDFGG